MVIDYPVVTIFTGFLPALLLVKLRRGKAFLLYFYRMAQELTMGDALKQFIKKSNLKNGVRKVQIESVWEELMGKTIAKHTEKIEIINQTLFIYTSTGPLKHILQLQKAQIIKLVNDAMGELVINDVVIR